MMDSMLWGLVLGSLRGEEELLEDLLKGIETPFDAASLIVSRVEGIRAGRDLVLEESDAWEDVVREVASKLGAQVPDNLTPRTARALLHAGVEQLGAERNQLQAELADWHATWAEARKVMGLDENVPPEQIRAHMTLWAEDVQKKAGSRGGSYPKRAPKGDWHWCDWAAKHALRSKGVIVGLVGTDAGWQAFNFHQNELAIGSGESVDDAKAECEEALRKAKIQFDPE
jgi:hypothetical protein